MQKKIACVNDISGIGKCSLTVALPIISALKCQCCPLPTSVLSSQTGYPEYTFVDLTESMEKYIDTWHRLKQNFDTIYSGFLGSSKQIKLVEHLIQLNQNSYVVVDPVLGDLGEIFPIFSNNDVIEMRKLVSMADLITPNITEANLLLGINPKKLDYCDNELNKVALKLCELGPKRIIITGVVLGDHIYNICFDKEQNKFEKIGVPFNKISFSGTGDTFTSIVAALITKGYDFFDSVKIATDFIFCSVEFTSKEENIDRNDGIMFEYFLDKLYKY